MHSITPVLNPVKNAQAALMGTGATALDENFYAATRYEAPAEGFNLTHLYFVGTVGDLENVDIEASVILGNDVTADREDHRSWQDSYCQGRTS